jgi:beta-glucosidase-like glycosyl hydrolase
MGSVHLPRLTGRGRAGPRAGRLLRRIGLAVAVAAAMAVAGGVHSVASAAADASYGVTAANGSANGYRSDGVDLETTADTQGNTGAGADDIGWTTPGQWFKYTVNVATAGTYTVAFRVASPYGITDALHIDNAAGTSLSGSVTIPNTGGYETWATVDASVTLPAGQQTLTVDQDSNGWNFHYMAFTLSSGGGGSGGTTPPGDAPFGGTPAAVPGTVQVANYDTGGQGVAYNVTSANGSANSYRADGVDLETTADTQDTSAPGGAYDMGWTNPGQWFNYTVNVATAGSYTVSFRVASPYGITDALHITNSSNVNLTGSVAVPNTGGYETWTTVTANVTLPAGVQTLTVDQDSNGFNFHYLAFATGSTSGGGGGTGTGKYCGTTDLAMDQPTTASSVQATSDYLPYYATDGDPGTRWSSLSTDPQWLEVDLGTPTAICSVGLLWEAAYATSFDIQTSNDNSTWTTVYSTTTGTGGQETFPISTTARYIRMYGLARATTFGYSIFEFDVYGPTNTPPLAGGNGNGGNGTCPWVGSTAPVATRVQQVLTTMDQSEAASLLSGDGTSSYIGQVNAIPDLCIPSINMEDGPSGVGDGNGGVTAFPDGENAAATFDPTLIEQEGSAMGAEFAGKGATVALGPTTNLVRDPRWGRTYETYGEDPYLAGQVTSAEVTGLQSQGVMAMVKHVAAYDQEQYPNGGNNETVGQQALEELYLAPFQTTIQQSAPAAMMCSYAVVNNAASCESADLLQDGLYEQANYGGFVTSDWGAAGSAVGDANAGMAVAMPFSDASNITAALTAGTLSQATVNSLVSEILTQMFAFGDFDNPPAGSLSATVTSAAHQQTALDLGEEGTVLLKNNGLLPLNPNMTGSIAVIGTDGGAAVELAGGGSGGVDSSNTVWPLTGIQDAVGPNVKVTYTAGDDNGTTDIPQAVAAAKAATDAIIYVNLPEGEESDLTSLDLSSADETMIEQVAAANPNTIVVINSGGPVVMPWLGNVAGVFENWYGGGETGAATAALVFGAVDPSGKLPVTFPASLSQVPAQTQAQWPGTATGTVYSEGVDIGYRWYQSQNIAPLFPFGFGLSYTKFAFSNLSVGAFNADGNATVTAKITNTGSVAGADVAQMYVGDPAASDDPPEQLKGFQRVTLSPGASATVTFPLTVHDLASWSSTANAWEAQAGSYSIAIGDSSASLPLTGSTSLGQTLTGQVAAGTSGAGTSAANTAVSANVTANSGVPGAETVGVVNPFGFSSPKGTAVSFPISAVDSNSAQTLAFTATGLPPGISIASNGTISGTGSTLGTYTVTVTATDAKGVSGTATFVWSVVQ